MSNNGNSESGHGFLRFVVIVLLGACVAGFFTDWFGCSNLLPVHVPSVRDFMGLAVKSSIIEMTEDMVKSVEDVHSEEFVIALTNGHSSDPSMMDEEIAPYVSLGDFFDVATSHMECEVTSVDVDKDVAVAHISVRNINVASVMQKWSAKMSDRSQWPPELQELAEEAEKSEKGQMATSSSTGKSDDSSDDAFSSLMRALTSNGQDAKDDTDKPAKKATGSDGEADDSADASATDSEEKLEKKLADWGWSLFKELVDEVPEDELVETDVTVTYKRGDDGEWGLSGVSGFSSALIGGSEADLIKMIIASSAMGEQGA